MRKITILLPVLLIFLTACGETTSTLDETITCTGLDEIVVNVGGTIDYDTGVSCESNTRGDVTSTIYLSNEAVSTVLGVKLVEYNVPYEDDTVTDFKDHRRVVVKHPSNDDPNNLVDNGDWDTFDVFGFSEHIDYDAEIRYLLDPDLKRIQVLITSVPTTDQWPRMYTNMMTLDSTKTYEISMLVSGTESTAFGIDVVEIGEFGAIEKTLMPKQQVNVPIQGDDMILYTYQFTPSENSTEACLRFVFGKTTAFEPSGHIFIDNVSVVEVTN